MSVTRVTAVENVELGEGPHWDVATQSLYYVDIFGKSVHRYTPSKNEHAKVTFDGGCVTLVVPMGDGKFVISRERELVTFHWDGKSDKVTNLEVICEVDSSEDACKNRINDGKCDPSGRLWFGTMGPEPTSGKVLHNKGNFFSIDSSKNLKTHITNVSISNGLAWSLDQTKFYYIDSYEFSVDQFDYDAKSDKISNRQKIFTFALHGIPGIPDGMTIDTDGNLWVAVFNGDRIIKIDPRKPETLLQTVSLPAKQITSVAFGGANLDELYVTSARLPQGKNLQAPIHGGLYKVTDLGVKGLPPANFKL